jgi:YggT family protein
VVIRIIIYLLEFYVIVLVARALLSWVPTRPGSPVTGVSRVLDRITEPVLRPVRRILPPIRAGGMGIDLSIIIVIVAAEILVSVLRR